MKWKIVFEVQNKKASKYQLDASTNTAAVNTNLNNAYFLDHFIALSDELNKAYPLNNYSFRAGFSRWNSLDNKEAPHAEFKNYADARLKEMRDSISQEQDKYVSVTNSLVQNIETIEYGSLKDSLDKLPSASSPNSKYFSAVINEVAKRRPDYFFRLAEDFPDKRSAIFNSVENNKQVIAGLKAVERHKDAKRNSSGQKSLTSICPLE
jgi:hypothetical protein